MSLTFPLLRRTLPFLNHLTPFSSPFSTSPPPPSSPTPPTEPWATILKPNFTPSDLTHALTTTHDPDLSWSLFRWATNSRHFTHTPSLYLTMLSISLTHNRPSITLSLLNLTLTGPCPPNLPLYNSLLKYTSPKPSLFNTTFQIYQKLLTSKTAFPNIETYTFLFNSLNKKFTKNTPLNPTHHIYLKSVKSLFNQMKQNGVIPNVYIVNMVIRANCRCLNLEEGVRVFKEMGLYNCEANEFSYSYLVIGYCEKGRVGEGLGWYREMKGKGLVATSKACMVLACGLAVEGRVEEGVEVVREMVECGRSPDVLTYRTVLEEMCRKGYWDEAGEVLEEWRGRDSRMGERVYRTLLGCLHYRR